MIPLIGIRPPISTDTKAPVWQLDSKPLKAPTSSSGSMQVCFPLSMQKKAVHEESHTAENASV